MRCAILRQSLSWIAILTATAMACGSDWVTHAVPSPYQPGQPHVKVLLPDRIESGRHYPALYILPVEPGNGVVWGDPTAEVKKLDLHNRYGLVCVYPTFSQLPWYADHPVDSSIRQESHLLHAVIPLVEKHYPLQRAAEGRLLVGFSKSGWGAYSLLLRHPELFGKAAAFDAPLAKSAPDQFGMGPIFGTLENFRHYEILKLLSQRAPALRGTSRLVLIGYANFRDQHVKAHEQMATLGILHQYRDGPWRKHHWSSGWLAEAVALIAPRQEVGMGGTP
jgi:S-formylglutathione hydrolase FrmB